MSLGSFLKGILNTIAGLFTNLTADLKTAIHIGVSVTEAVQTVVDSPVADIVAALIPDGVGPEIEATLKLAIPKILVDLKLVDATLGLTDPNEITAAAIKVLSELDPSVKPAFLHSISILVAQVAADGKLSWSDGIYLLQWYYENMYKAVPASTSSDTTSASEDNQLAADGSTGV